MEACAATFLFDFGNPVEFVGIGLEVFVEVSEPGDGVEARAVNRGNGEWRVASASVGSYSHNEVGHADDRRGVHAAAEFGEDGAVGAEAASHRCSEGGAEVFFVFGVCTVADSLAWIKIPILTDDVFS